MWADILPHDLALVRHFEDAPVASFADKRISVGKPLRTRDVGAEEFKERLVGVLPHDRPGARIHFNNTRERGRMIAAVGAVVEDQEVTVRQRTRIVLLCEGWA